MSVTRRVNNNRLLSPSAQISILCFALLLSTSKIASAQALPKAKAQTPIQKSEKKKSPPTRKPILVPPPPPTIPGLVGMSPGPLSMGSSTFIDYLSLDDLKWKQESYKKELASLELDLEDAQKVLDEKLKNSKNFEELFSEGVVSRKELENVSREADRIKRSVERHSRKVEDTKRMLSKIDTRIVTLEKEKTQKQAKTQKKTKKRTRSKTKKSK